MGLLHAPCVHAISFSHSNVADVWYWNGDRIGNYIVKSGYRLLKQQCPLPRNYSSFHWKLIWGLNVPSKVKITVWRSITQCLPAMVE